MARSMIHLNSNLLAAISIGVTGDRPRYNDVIQVAVLPLDASIKPLKGILPFYTEMKPRREENINFKDMSISKIELYKLMQTAMDADRLADLFDEWFNKLGLKVGKKIVPVAYNWPRMYGFLEDWLGYEHMCHYFSTAYRDPFSCAMYDNDKADAQVEQVPYPKYEAMCNLCFRVGMDAARTKDSLANAIATAELYKRMLAVGHFTPISS